MDRSVNRRGLLADVLHNVDLTACWPVDTVDVVSQHPEGGPQALSIWNFHAGFKAAVGLDKFPQSFQPCRSVVPCHAIGSRVLFLLRLDYEVSILHIGILQTICVVLQFLIAPPIAANFRRPL